MYLFALFLPLLFTSFILVFGNHIGIKGIQYLLSFKIIFLYLLSLLIINDICFNNCIVYIPFFEWILKGYYLGLLFDFNSTIMIFLIINIYSIVLFYSFWYMKDDPFIIRFLGFLGLFTLMMILLVLSNNSLTLLIGWEGVGLSSYLLINFWFLIIQANKSAIKAIIYNKVGDIFLILGVIMSIVYHNSNLWNLFYLILDKNKVILSYIAFFFIIAAMAKSAQFFFDSWLGDAMMGPTPVSALLHAATMVTAGIFLINRSLPSFIISTNIINIGLIIGLFTIILGGFIALFQNDIKKIIAYSTCSQLGYMFYSSFIGIYNHSFFHLFIHGFFKALLFLSGGIIIHNFFLNQDCRKSGSFILNLPLSFLFFFLGFLSIISFPFFSGFYSKEPLISYSFISPFFVYFLSLLGAFFTVAYSFRLFFNLFFRHPTFYFNPITHEPSFHFFILLFGSLLLGFFAFNFFNISNLFFSSYFLPFSFDLEFLALFYKLLPFIIIPIGIYIGYNIDNIIKLSIYDYIKYIIPLYTIFNKRFFFDYIYNKMISLIFFNSLFKYIDNGILDISAYIKRYINK